MKIELGGGGSPKGEGFVNVDIMDLPGVDIICDVRNAPLPFQDDSVDEVYSSHMFEHLSAVEFPLHEIARVCKLGAKFEMRVPHTLSAMAMVLGHTTTVSPDWVRHWCEEYVGVWWAGCKKRLRLDRYEDIPGGHFPEARRLFPNLTSAEVMRYIPNAAFEHRFYFTVVPNEGGGR